MADIDIKIKLQAAKAEADLAKFNAQVGLMAEKEKQAALQTQILQQRLDNLEQAGKRGAGGLNTLNIAFASFIGNITSRAITAGINTLIGGISSLVSAGKDFEAGLIQISKTTGLGESATKAFGDEIIKISQRIPVATENLLQIATVAGQLGIQGVDNLTAFTETIAKLELATDVVGEQGSQDVARILTLTDELRENGVENIQKFGSVLTQLGNNFAATESQILGVANEVAKGTSAFNLASEDVLGLATAFKVTGSEAEISGSTIQKVFANIAQATQDGGDSLTKFAQAAGLTEEQFTALFQQDPTAAFLKLAEGLNKTTNSGAELIDALKGLGFEDQRLVRSLTPLIARYNVLNETVAQARKEAEEKTALDRETSKAQESLNADLQKLSNTYTKLGVLLFETIGPALRQVVQLMTSMIEIINNNIGLFTAFAIGITAVATALGVVALKAAIAAGAFSTLTIAATAAWVAITGPIGLAVAGIAALVAILAVATNGFDDSDKKMEQYRKNLDALDAGYKAADKDGQQFLSTLTSTIGGMEEANAPLERQIKLFEELPAPVGQAGVELEKFADTQMKLAVAVTAFENDKTRELKKFFKEEEIAKLNSNFAILQSEKEKNAFLDFVASEGQRRQSEAFKATIGLDKATLEAQREFQEQMKELREAEDKYMQERAEARFKLIEDEKQSQLDLAIAEEALRLFKQEEEQIFLDDKLVALQEYYTREEEARIQAAINAEQDETKRQILINKAVQEGLNKRLQQEQRAALQQRQIDATIAQSRVQIASSTSELITTILGNASKEAFIISKAVAFAENIVNTQAALATIDATWAWNPPVAATLSANARIQGAIRGATILAAAVQGFEQGGVVGGTSFTGDNVMARVNSGEMILNRQQQNQLFQMANGGSNNSKPQEITIHTRVDLDGEQVGYAVSRQVANGLVLGEVQ